MLKLFVVGEGREIECLASLCHQHWNQFCAKVPKNYTPLVGSLQEFHSIDDFGDKLIWQTTKDIQQSLQEIFLELLGSHSLLAVADTSFNDQVTSGESYLVTVTHLLLIIKWLIQLIQYHLICSFLTSILPLRGGVMVVIKCYISADCMHQQLFMHTFIKYNN